MNDSLQSVQNIAIQNGSVKKISASLIDLIISNGFVAISIMVCLFVLLVVSLYIFFERYFTLKKISKENSSLLNDIKDCIHDGKIDSAIDLCKRNHTPESRILLKGVMRLGKPARDINDALENTTKTEVFDLGGNVDVLNVISKSAPILGILGSLISFIISSFTLEPQTHLTGLTLISTVTGIFVGLIAFIFYSILVIKIKNYANQLHLTNYNFLDILNKPVI